MVRRNYADESRDAWGCDGIPTIDQLTFGAVQRIAAAVEKMAHPYVRLLSRVEYLEKRLNDEIESGRKARRRIFALRGVVTRMKKRTAGKGA